MNSFPHSLFVLATLILVAVPLVFTGCAVHYYDKHTGTEHLWGFGHMKMRVAEPDEGVRAVVKGTSQLGFAVGLGQEDPSLSVGWSNSRRLSVLNENTSVRFEWPTSGFYNVRVGTNAPQIVFDSSQTNNMEKKGNNQ